MLLGVHTGLHDAISVQDLGIDNLTAADGLAVGRASGFVGRAMQRLIDGYYTLNDQRLYDMLRWLSDAENIQLEPSALAGMYGAVLVSQASDYLNMRHFSEQQLEQATHLVWATGEVWCLKLRCKNIWHKVRRRLNTMCSRMQKCLIIG
jgi:D-serine dehydratase